MLESPATQHEMFSYHYWKDRHWQMCPGNKGARRLAAGSVTHRLLYVYLNLELFQWSPIRMFSIQSAILFIRCVSKVLRIDSTSFPNSDRIVIVRDPQPQLVPGSLGTSRQNCGWTSLVATISGNQQPFIEYFLPLSLLLPPASRSNDVVGPPRLEVLTHTNTYQPEISRCSSFP